MDLFKVSEALLRSPQPLLPFLAPSASRIPQKRGIEAVSRHCGPQRQAFSTSQLRRQQDAVTAQREPSYANGDQSRNAQRPSQADSMSSLLDSAFKSTPTAPSTRPSSPPSRLGGSRQGPRPGSSLDDLFEAMKVPKSGMGGARGGAGNFRDIQSMLDPSSNLTRNNPLPPNRPPPPTVPVDRTLPIRLNPSVGRTVAVSEARGIDVGRAFRMLEMQCARNSVRRDFMRQRFHERPGLKRKRLRSERWRRRFKANFLGVVGMVQRMRRMGW